MSTSDSEQPSPPQDALPSNAGAGADGGDSFVPSVSEAEEALARLLKGWRSRYRHIIQLSHADRRVVQFHTEWARHPTPMEPLPQLRVGVDFAFLYDAKMWRRAGNSGPPPAQISYRIEHERTVHSGPAALARNIDHHILRHLKFKAEFARNNPLPLTKDQTSFFESRAAYEPLAHVEDSHLGSFARFADSATASDASTVERELIAMFQRADYDGNGSLDPEEFAQLLLNSKWGFTKEDVQVVMQAHDANADGSLVYSEFVSCAIDLVQAQRASAYAQQMTTSITEAAYKAALARIQASKELHRAMDSGLGRLDPADTGIVATSQLADLLRQLDLDLTEGEINAILARLRALNKAAAGSASAHSGAATPASSSTPAGGGSINIRLLQENYEDLILQAVQKHHLDQEASDVEVYLNALFRKRDVTNSGVLSERDIAEVLAANPAGVRLSPTQIYAILGDHKPLDGQFKYRLFARKAAHMIYMLFDAEALAERSSMIRRSAITPIQLLGAPARRRIEQAIRAKLHEFDHDNDGCLSRAEFAAAMRDTALQLSGSEVELLFTRADANGDGKVDQEEFVQFSYETLLHLQRDAALKAHMANALKQKAAHGSAAAGASTADAEAGQ